MDELSFRVHEESESHAVTMAEGGRLRFRRAEPSDHAQALRTDEDGARLFASHLPVLSSRHAEMFMRDGRLFIKDLQSTNGTWVKLDPFKEHPLSGNFEVLLGQGLLVQRDAPPWENFPDVAGFAQSDDFIAHLRGALSNITDRITVLPLSSPNVLSANGNTSIHPLFDGEKCLCVQWKKTTSDVKARKWLQAQVSLFNSSHPVDEEKAARADSSWAFLAASPARRYSLRLAQRLAASSCTILVIGPSGAGKEVIVRDLHNHSQRASGPFVPINCAALPDTLIESELFGVSKGAFTGAVERPGLVEKAKNGTLFLDEIGDLPLHLQPKLLRVLEDQKFRRVGDTEERTASIRVLAATHKDLEVMVAEGKFREDLFYRLNTVQLDLPALQAADVAVLVPGILQKAADENEVELQPDEKYTITQLATQITWRGNARELRSALSRYAALRKSSDSVTSCWKLTINRLTRAAHATPVVANPTSLPRSDAPLTCVLQSGTLKDCMSRITNLCFLVAAKETLFPFKHGSLTELGKRFSMSGAGASARLRRLKIPMNSAKEPSLQHIEERLRTEQAELQPYHEFLRSLLRL